ncbi:MAG: imidazolonepropionase-like amidohydrolase [Planctomycetota bacterium]|jgi:imidazolonepropionase-like amidohydrolase
MIRPITSALRSNRTNPPSNTPLELSSTRTAVRSAKAMKNTRTRITGTLAACIAAVASFGATTTAQDLVVEAGTVITGTGETIEDGVIVIQGGRITAVGKAGEVEKPWDATVVGGPEFTAFPGFVEAYTDSGMDRANENIDVTPFLNIRDSVDPVAYYFEDSLRAGITTINVQQGRNCVIGGQGMIVKPIGLTIEEMQVRPNHGLVMAASPKNDKSRSTQAQVLRRAFTDLRTYLEETVKDERDERGLAAREALFQGRELKGEDAKGRAMASSAWSVDGLELIPRGAIDEKQAPLLDVVEGRRAVYFWCLSPLDVTRAIEVAKANGFLGRTVLIIDDACWEAADAMAAAGVPVVLDGSLVHTRRDPVTGEEIETFVPGVLRDKGVRFALSSQNASTNSLWYQAALATGLGLTREEALAAVTTTAADIIGLGDEVGSLTAGKHGNVLLMTGDPLSVTSWVEHVVIEGRQVYSRADDVRNRHLLEGVQPANTDVTEEVPSPEQEDDSK